MRRAAIAIVVLAAAALPQAAAGHSLVLPEGPAVTYLSADAVSLNTLTVAPSGNRIEFRDPTAFGGIDPGGCTPGEVSGGLILEVFCPAAGVSSVRLNLGEREDTAVVSLSIPVTLLGGDGADNLTGGAGDDAIDGGLGADALAGGAGADRLISRDGLADTVGCGDGADDVDADTLDKVAADCESVTRTEVGSPGTDEPGPPSIDVGAETVQKLTASRRVRVLATSSEPGSVSASGFLRIGSLRLPLTNERRRLEVGGGGAEITYVLSHRRARRAASALERGRRVTVSLDVVATDLGGNSTKRAAPRIRLVRNGAGGDDGPASRPIAARHPEPGDTDGDNIFDGPPYPGPPYDNCVFAKNGSQLDTDGDGAGDACDADDDADGINDLDPSGAPLDNCRIVANPTQIDSDGDGFGDACPPVHSDTDGIPDFEDNCPVHPNAEQQDLDGDDRGDVCDGDDDGDKLDDPFDNCPTVYSPYGPLDYNGDGVVNWRDQSDADRDGVGTLCDPDEGATPLGPRGPNDDSPPEARVQAAKRQRLVQLEAGMIVRLRCSEACSATAELTISSRAARRLDLGQTRVIASGSAELDGAGDTYAFVRVSKRAAKALAGHARVPAKLETGIVDRSNNVERKARPVQISG